MDQRDFPEDEFIHPHVNFRVTDRHVPPDEHIRTEKPIWLFENPNASRQLKSYIQQPDGRQVRPKIFGFSYNPSGEDLPRYRDWYWIFTSELDEFPYLDKIQRSAIAIAIKNRAQACQIEFVISAPEDDAFEDARRLDSQIRKR